MVWIQTHVRTYLWVKESSSSPSEWQAYGVGSDTRMILQLGHEDALRTMLTGMISVSTPGTHVILMIGNPNGTFAASCVNADV